MRCFHPLEARRLPGGEVKVGRDPAGVPMRLRCGQCIGCSVSRSQDWAVRCCNEAKLYDQSVFVTLTWDEEKLKVLGKVVPLSLDHRPFQLFAKRARKALGPFRYFMCGEYGTNFGRPHYHALMFGVGFPDRQVFKTNPMTLYRSATLERLWPFGYSSIGDVTMESAQYVAGYVTQQKRGQEAEDHYWKLNEETGELFQVTPEYGRMSLKPGIGAHFFDRFHAEVTVRDGSVVNGVVMKPPRYYDRQLKGFSSIDRKRGTATFRRAIDRRLYDEILARRLERSDANAEDDTPERLRVAETVVKSRMALKRHILE